MLGLNMEFYQRWKNFLEKSDYHNSNARFKVDHFYIASFAPNFWFLIEISMDGIKPVVAEKRQFEGRHESEFSAISGILRTIRMEKPYPRVFRNWFATSWKLSIETLMELISSYGVKVFDNRAFSKLMAVQKHQRSLRIMRRLPNAQIFPGTTLVHVECFR